MVNSQDIPEAQEGGKLESMGHRPRENSVTRNNFDIPETLRKAIGKFQHRDTKRDQRGRGSYLSQDRIVSVWSIARAYKSTRGLKARVKG